LTPEDQDGTESKQDGSLAMLDPVKELGEYRGLLLKPEALLEPLDLEPLAAPAAEDEFADCTPEERERLRGLVKVASRLQALTGWTRVLLLDNIGCDDRDTKELVKDAEHTERCTTFLQTLLDAAERVDSARSCQAVVKRCARLSKGLDVVRFQRVLRDGHPSPLDYISLGELSTAIRVARIATDKEKPASSFGPGPYDSADAVHLSTPRIDLFVQGKRGALGERAYASMAAHIESCSACGEVVAARRSLMASD
jgi:hypothetical protein